MQSYRLKFGTIIVATDLKDIASSALRYAQAIARLHGSTLVIVHVIDPVGYAFPNGAPASVASDLKAREEVSRIEDEIRRAGIPVHSVVGSGVICERILEAVNDHHGDLLVLGTRSKTEAGRVALGMIARQLLAKAPCPVLTISPNADAYLPWAGRWRHVLVATDFSAASLSAIGCAHRIVHEHLLAFHATEHSDAYESAHCLERLRFLAPFNESHTVPVEHIVSSGDAGRLIVERARKFNTDLVVLGSPANELTEEDLQTSTVLQVISQVTCPVLCVPSAQPQTTTEFTHEVASV